MSSDPTIWYLLRLTRHRPLGRANETPESADLYNAALQQFEEYMTAAAAVGPATRPLHLYYALAQAGAAILTVRGVDVPNSHGLTIGDPHRAASLHALQVAPKGAGLFQAVSAATGSDAISGPVYLGAVWGSLPELVETIDEAEWPVALRLRTLPTDQVALKVPDLTVRAIIEFQPTPPSARVVERRLERYPTARGYSLAQPPGVPGLVSILTTDLLYGGVPMTWPARDWSEHLARLEEVAPAYRDRDDRWLRPGLGENVELPTPLMSWWLMLFTLSMLSRYHPRTWASMLRIDRSSVAADIEFCLDAALEAVPRLAFDGLATTADRPSSGAEVEDSQG